MKEAVQVVTEDISAASLSSAGGEMSCTEGVPQSTLRKIESMVREKRLLEREAVP